MAPREVRACKCDVCICVCVCACCALHSLPDSDDRSSDVVAYNGEVCPICLGAPKIGVKAPCGHLLCAVCLASYCDVRVAAPAAAAAPPPCPLCRAPLNSVALACDFVSTTTAAAELVALPRDQFRAPIKVRDGSKVKRAR